MTIEKHAPATVPLDIPPAPGPRPPRPRWTGESASPSVNGAFAEYLPTPAEKRRRLFEQRFIGVHAGKGFALLAMVAVHTLPRLDPSTGEATWTWTLFAGTATALFCVIAGIGLAFDTGANTRYVGRAFDRSLLNIGFQAVLLVGLGLVVNSLVELPESDILVYIGAMYLLALPLYALRGRQLLVVTGVLILLTPLIRYAFDYQLQGAGHYVNPVFSHVFQDPAGVVSTVLLTGSFPALTWITFLCLGLAIGRLTLLRPGTPLLLLTVGLIIGFGAKLTSWFLVRSPEGYNTMRSSMADASQTQIDRFLVFGSDGALPTTTPGWLLSAAPMASTPWSIAASCGFSLAAIGLLIALIRKLPQLLRPIIDVGTMPITIYVGHLFLLTLFDSLVTGWALFTFEVIVLVAFATLWRRLFSHGPLEYCVSRVATFATQACMPAHPRARS
ncbi:heparan-alpha-glucosaminide N-acetyltransferase domain-containing protein [Yaniella halotolerans]|uniref:heparan-alpha-glucosaminide N-acetyltransferase domain-containing protein n=1 Tax=Yaniella halotolerans TaxID=225453 RepID=UPI0003B46DBE|nr:heparan-alpha-glucosaminide N-acetyltransferase domain-containing protein [Yaniella halotolerans]